MYLEDIKTERRGVVGSCSISYCYNTDTSQYNSKLREFKKVIYSQEPVGWLGQLCFIMWVCSCVPASWVSHSWGSNWAKACHYYGTGEYKASRNIHVHAHFKALLTSYHLTSTGPSNQHSREQNKRARKCTFPLARRPGKLLGKGCRYGEVWRIGTNNAICDRLQHVIVMGYKTGMVVRIYYG